MTREEAIMHIDGMINTTIIVKGIVPDEYDIEALRMAIEALSADAVSREECDECKTDKEGVLLQQLAELQGDYETMKNAYEDALADAEWIPCSERLPEKTDIYLVTYGNTHGGKVEQMVYPMHYWQKRWMSFDHSWESKTVAAWMPLPKPYKGGDDE